MTVPSTTGSMSPGLLRVREMAKRDPEMRFCSLAYLIDEEMLMRGFRRLRKNAAVGVDSVTVDQYGARLEDNVRALRGKMKAGQYRHQPIRRVHIPKGPGKTRPIGIPATEDKIVQHALREVLEGIYEQDFYDCSYGFRPGRSAHDAIRDLNREVGGGRIQWILEADISSYFDSIDRKMLMGMLQTRVTDGSLLRLVGKCLHVGVLDGTEYSEPDAGTAQGSVLSPLLGNIFLHHVLDRWFHREVRPRLGGRALLIRYADDFVIGFERKEDAELVMQQLHARMEQHGLKLHPDKTRLIPFQRPPGSQQNGKGPATFDFLGFTAYWRRDLKGRWRLGLMTRRARAQRMIESATEYCRRHRHDPVREQHAALCSRLSGHINYFGVNGNWDALDRVISAVARAWHKWLNRRSQRRSMDWERFKGLLTNLPLPRARITVQIWV